MQICSSYFNDDRTLRIKQKPPQLAVSRVMCHANYSKHYKHYKHYKHCSSGSQCSGITIYNGDGNNEHCTLYLT